MSRLDRKAQITSAALELFRRKGFAAVSTRDLSEHAGLSRSHLYHYFSDWNALRREAFVCFAGEQLEEVRLALEGSSGPEALRVFLHNCLPTTADSDWMLWLDAWDEAMHDPELAQAYQRINGEWQALLARIIEEGVARQDFHCASCARAARQLFSLAMGYADDLLLQPSEQAASAALDELLEVAGLLLQTPP